MEIRGPRLTALNDVADPRLTLVCLPHAGANADVFRPWAALLSSGDTQLLSVNYPGRRDSAGLPPLGIHELGQCLAPQLNELPTEEIIVFGHSMGALVGFELLARVCRPALPTLVASGSPAPQVRVTQPSPIDQEARIQQLLHSGGTPSEVLADGNFATMLTDLLRSDLRACDEYSAPSPTVQARVLAVCALDDPVVSVGTVTPWSECCLDFLGTKYFMGGHMFAFEHAAEVLALCLGS